MRQQGTCSVHHAATVKLPCAGEATHSTNETSMQQTHQAAESRCSDAVKWTQGRTWNLHQQKECVLNFTVINFCFEFYLWKLLPFF